MTDARVGKAPTRRTASSAPKPHWRSTTALVVAIALLVAVPLAPTVIGGGGPFALLRLPVESIVVTLLLTVLPWRRVRLVVAIVFGLFVVTALLLAGLDAAWEYALDIPFDPSNWPEIGDGFGVVQNAIGVPISIVVVVLLGLAAIGTVVALAWAALRVNAALRRHVVRGRGATVAMTAAWVVAALVGLQFVAGQPAAASASVDAVAAAASRVSDSQSAQADLAHEIQTDPAADIPSSDLLTALRGKDVVIAFIESYGQVAVQGTSFSEGVDTVLRDGGTQLAADGYSSQSAFLTSPTFGGISWLAHSTLQSGLWINEQPLYDSVVASTRFTLSDAFRKAGWNTVSDVPSDTEPWPYGTSFYHYSTLYNAKNVGYQGPQFGYAQIPDEYTWKYFADHELSGPHQPVMAEIDFVSSHTPWAPLPQLVPWSSIGDGSIYAPQPAEGHSATSVWQDPRMVQQAYGQSIQYSLGSMVDFLHNTDDPDLVVIALGDHQPATIVSGVGANHEVPISIITKDPSVLQAIQGWHWQDGLLPAPDAPVWPMSDFRDRFLAAYDTKQ
jgi:hypothetical protein